MYNSKTYFQNLLSVKYDTLKQGILAGNLLPADSKLCDWVKSMVKEAGITGCF